MSDYIITIVAKVQAHSHKDAVRVAEIRSILAVRDAQDERVEYLRIIRVSAELEGESE